MPCCRWTDSHWAKKERVSADASRTTSTDGLRATDGAGGSVGVGGGGPQSWHSLQWQPIILVPIG